MFARLFTIASILAVAVNAIKVTSPTGTQNWGTTGAQTVSWESVSSDPTSFSVTLVSPVSRFRIHSVVTYTYSTSLSTLKTLESVTLVANQSTSAGSTTVTPPR